ncbi:natural killer cells antigen CD94-like [Sorex araneus]|uniref:natural killer cells antigen CD94-like n=1 Tax=Sorex araneus TaxID=42254 RepID=UPI0024334DCE|nr:natural killer cells antigen CD94-like [Sorex araneus]
MDLYENFKVKEKKLLNRNMKLKGKPRRCPVQIKRGFPWHCIASSLGILCVLLLLATITLGYMFFQCSSKWKIQDNKVTNEKSHTLSQTIKEKDCDVYQGKWSCCGKNCYYFSKEEKTWNESRKSCQDLESNLIKIDDQEEQLFIQSKIKYSYWVGLHKKGTNSPWMWTDGTGPSWKLTFQATTFESEEKCGRLKSINIVDAVCTKEFHFICERNLSSS